MYQFKRSFTAITGALVFVLVAMVSMPHIGRGAGSASGNTPTSSTQTVKVVNSTTEPVPVQGMVQVAQSGTWNVGITGTPVVSLNPANNTVKIDTTTPLPVGDVYNPALQPLQASAQAVVTDFQTAIIDMGHVPAGKRFVIEQATSQGSISTGAIVQVTITTTAGGTQTSHALVVDSQRTVGGQDYFTGSQLTRLYADPDSEVLIEAQGVNGGGNVSFSISGYLVSVP